MIDEAHRYHAYMFLAFHKLCIWYVIYIKVKLSKSGASYSSAASLPTNQE